MSKCDRQFLEFVDVCQHSQGRMMEVEGDVEGHLIGCCVSHVTSVSINITLKRKQLQYSAAVHKFVLL